MTDGRSIDVLRSYLVRPIRAFGGVLGLAAACTVACGVTPSGPAATNPSPPRSKPASADGPYAIHVYVGEASAPKRFDFGPVREASGGSARAPAPTSGGGVKPTAVNVLAFDGGGAALPDEATVDAPGDDVLNTGWGLIMGALAECGAPSAIALPWGDERLDTGAGGVGWIRQLNERWFVYGTGKPGSAAEAVRREEELLCTADKLAEIADAVGPTEWRHDQWRARNGAAVAGAAFSFGTAQGTDFASLVAKPWTIPAQADKDRFIARDLAIHMIGLIAFLDGIRIGYPPATASEVLANVAQSGLLGDENDQTMHAAFGVSRTEQGPDGAWHASYPAYPPSKVPVFGGEVDTTNGHFVQPLQPGDDHSKEIARSAMAIQAQILRSAGRLLHDLVRRSVYSDMAGAEQRAAHAMDPSRGNRIAWGAEGPYNSLAHAMRVLGGRWEIGPRHADLACAGVGTLELLDKAYGDDRSARSEDAPIQTRGQASASQLIETSGIVLSSCSLANATDEGIRAAVVGQLLARTGAANGVQLDPAGPQAEALRRTVAQQTAGDLRFALRRAYATYRMLANLAEVGAPEAGGAAIECAPIGANVAGMRSEAVVSDAVTRIGGIVIDGGIGRGKLSSDVMAHASALLEASACNESADAWSSWGTETDQGRGSLREDYVDSEGRTHYSWRFPRTTFQSAFHIGQALERSLTRLRSWADVAAIKGTTAGNPETTARAGMAELRSWAGSAMFVASTDTPPGAALRSIHVAITGVDDEELALTRASTPSARTAAVRDAFRFVYGPAWLAECAAHVRAGCPADTEARAVKATTVAEQAASDAAARTSGTVGSRYDLVVDVPSTGTTFQPVYRGLQTGSDHLYVIRTRDPKDAGGRGAVLGTIALRQLPTITGWETLGTTFVVSPMQRELMQVALGIGKWVGERPPRIGDASAAKSAGYCVDGVQRDMFVPLENELTSDSDQYENSWRHYLTLAKQAASRADALGKDLLDLKLRQDERLEAAGEALGDICGDLGAINHVEPDETGKMVPSPEDETLKVCLGEDKKDVVFLGEIPAALGEESTEDARAAEQTAWVKTNVLLCPNSNELCAKPRLSYASLGLVKAAPAAPDADKLCVNATIAAGSLRTGFDAGAFASALAEDTGTAEARAIAAHNLKFHVDTTEGDWGLDYASVRVMDTRRTDLWPGCMRAKKPCPPNAKVFNAAYRFCRPEVTDVDATPLGECDPPFSGDAVWAELNTLRWRIEGSLWYLGKDSGGVPGGMFSVPIPIYDGRATGVTDAPLLAYNNNSYKQTPAGTWVADPAHTLPFAIREMGTAHSVPASLGHYNAYAVLGEIPPWYYDIYKTNAPSRAALLQSWAKNAADWRDPGYDVSPLSMPKLAGAVCTKPSGPPTDGRVIDGLANAVAAVKINGYDYRPGTADIVSGIYAPRFHRMKETGDVRLQLVPTEWGFAQGDLADIWQMYPAWVAQDFTSVLLTTGRGAGDPLPPYWMRVRAYVNSGPPHGDCGAAATIAQSYALACASRAIPISGLKLTQAPQVNDVEDIGNLQAWLAFVAEQTKAQFGTLYVEKVPLRVIEDFRSNRVGTGSKKGSHGAAFLSMEAGLTALPGQWARLATNLVSVSKAIEDARIAMAGAELAKSGKLHDIALAEIRSQAQMAQSQVGALAAMGGLFASAFSGGAGMAGSFVNIGSAMASGDITMDAHRAEMNNLDAMKDEADKKRALDVAAALGTLNTSTTAIWANTESTLGEVRATVSSILTAAESMELLESKANYEAAKGRGDDFVVIAGQDVPLPVNTVLRRQASATEIRYRRALNDAKGLAYMARRAIEQRIGTPLAAITTRVGALDPPANWADNVCQLTGIDYGTLRTANPVKGGAEDPSDARAINEFADLFVGDYVADLESFVEYYNVEFPSHEADDTAILSMKDDLVGPTATCVADAKNLLFNSGRLVATASTTSVGDGSKHAWALHGCPAGATKCLATFDGVMLAAPNQPPSRTPGPASASPGVTDDSAGVTWLTDVSPPPPSTTIPAARAGLVSQAVDLDPGTYVLSWWDQARTLTGELPAASVVPPSYAVSVFDADWGLVKALSPRPYVAADDTASKWSARHTVVFTVKNHQTYTIGFGASAPGSGVPGSVAIADVQLELASTSGEPGVYQETTDTRSVVTRGCTRSSAAFRALFERRCVDVDHCYYELATPMIINTEDLRDGVSRLEGKLARGNHNFRHVTTALNLAGTGVRDCASTPTSSCFGTGYTEYTLEHDATTAGILDWNGDTRFFNFGIARIEHGKALTAERYISMPPGSADVGLLQQAGIQKPELRGRPLDGTYRIRIWDSPSLRWDRLEDIQLVVQYRYWSRIDRSGQGM
jgi:hypothetical protein